MKTRNAVALLNGVAMLAVMSLGAGCLDAYTPEGGASASDPCADCAPTSADGVDAPNSPQASPAPDCTDCGTPSPSPSDGGAPSPPPVVDGGSEGPPPGGGHWYVRPGGTGAKTGVDWNNAWDTGGIAWNSVQPGDAIWLAGGTYSSGIHPTKSGTAGNIIYIERVRSSDTVPTSAPGYQAAFDSQVIVSSSSPLVLAVSYFFIDGRIDMGMRFAVSNSGGLPTSCNVTGGAFLTLSNLDLTGPSAVGHEDGSSCGNQLASMNGDSSGMMIGYGYSPNPGAHDVTLRNSRVRGHANEFWFAKATNITIENNRIYDNGAANSATWHGNMMIVNGSDGITFRNNEVFNWQVEGLYPWGSVSRNWYVYGNVFHDGIGGKNGSTHRFLELRSYSGTITHGPFFVHHNTITNCWAAFTRGDMTVFWSADSVARNNIFFNLANSGIGYAPPTADHNFSDGNAGGGAGSISSGAQPFVNAAAGDFHLTSSVGANLPRDKGVALDAAYSVDRDGKTRGADGAWDIGAYEL